MFNNIIKLKPNNFTPLVRTPWAGQVIAQTFKSQFVNGDLEMRIGESWEFSCDPNFPSIIADGEQKLSELVLQYPNEILSPDIAEKSSTCEILVKLLNADSPLSLQVHPTDEDLSLKAGECGKPESWYILDHNPGCGIYLGFAKPISKEELKKALQDGSKAKDLLQFVPVEKGDYFEIDPKVPHAIGPGVTLLEPQRILFGKSGKTYRMWDWGRKYDSLGKENPLNGKARELHLEEALKLVDPLVQVGEGFVDSTRRNGENINISEGVTLTRFPANNFYQLCIISMDKNSECKVEIESGYGVCLQLGGKCNFNSKVSKSIEMKRGESSLLPFKAMPLSIGTKIDSELAIIIPATARLEVK